MTTPADVINTIGIVMTVIAAIVYFCWRKGWIK